MEIKDINCYEQFYEYKRQKILDEWFCEDIMNCDHGNLKFKALLVEFYEKTGKFRPAHYCSFGYTHLWYYNGKSYDVREIEKAVSNIKKELGIN